MTPMMLMKAEHHGLGYSGREALVRYTLGYVPLLRVELGSATLAGTPQGVAEGLGALRHGDAEDLADGGEVGAALDGAGAVHLEDVRGGGGDEQGENDDLYDGGEDDEDALADGDVEHLAAGDAGLAAVDRGRAAGRTQGCGLRQRLVHAVDVVRHG